MKNLYLTILGVIFSVGIMAQTNTTIYAVQGQAASSPFENDSVIVSGLVTAVDTNYGDIDGYYIQDGTGPWSGIYVYDYANQPLVGDSVTVEAKVSEYYGLTELTYVKTFTIISSGHTITPIEITATQANSEEYEGVFVKVRNLTCMSMPTSSAPSYGSWDGVINNITIIVDDALMDWESFVPTLSEEYDVIGIIDYHHDDYRINPRISIDVAEASSIEGNVIGETKIFPIPASDKINVTSKENINSIELFNIIGKSVYTETFKSVNKISLDIHSFNTGMYMLKVNYDSSSSVYRVVVK